MDRFWDDFEDYIRSYLPQWQYDKESGEPESALLCAAAEMLLDSRKRLEEIPKFCELEFLRAWALERQAATPMCAYATLTAPDSQSVPTQSEFYLSGDGARLWRTEAQTQAEPARLTDQVLVSGSRGKIIPLPPITPETPTRLYDFRSRGAQRREARFAHPYAFVSQCGCEVRLTLPDASEALLTCMSDAAWVRWTLVCASGEVALPTPKRDGRALIFALQPASDALALMVSVEIGLNVPTEIIGRAFVETERIDLPCASAVGDDGPYVGERWLPFGPDPEEWRTCCLSCPDALQLCAASVSISFALSTQKQEYLLQGVEQALVYRPIMRRLPAPPPPIRDVYINQVAWEYWNGRAWLPIPGAEGYTGCFGQQEASAARLEVCFPWPTDAAPCEIQGVTATWLRWRVRRVESSGWLPRCSHAPEVTQLRFTARLKASPAAITCRSGLELEFSPLRDPRTALFPPLGPEKDGWWLGFDRPPEAGSMQLYLSLRDRVPGGMLTAWEGGAEEGRHPLVLEDGTDGLCHSGILILSGIKGERSVKFGALRWWLCLQDESGVLAAGRRYPVLDKLMPGAVRILSSGEDSCLAGEALAPLRGGVLYGSTCTNSFGGTAAETDTELLRRARWQRHHRGRAVSPLDVDQLLRAKLRDVACTRCVRRKDTLSVGVLMRDMENHAAAFSLRQKEILRLLECESGLPTLGLKLAIIEPNFYPVGVTLWIRNRSCLPFDELQRILMETLARFLNPVSGNFHGEGWQLGDLPTVPQLQSCLQAASPEMNVVELLITATAPDGRELDGAEVHDPFALPMDGRHTIRELRGDERA